MDSRRFEALNRTLAALTVGLSIAACSPSDPPSPAPTGTVTVTSMVPRETVTVTAAVSDTPTSGADTTTAEAQEIATMTGDEEALTLVDPQDFRGPGAYNGYFFVSPSGNLSCGVWDWNPALTGCQAWSLVANLPECDDPLAASSPAVEFYQGQPADLYCSTDGMFLAEAPVLEYGQQLSVLGVTCISRNTGVTCVDEASGFGFLAARSGFIPLGP